MSQNPKPEPVKELGPNERRCSLCEKVKPLENYRPRKDQAKGKTNPVKVKTCMVCEYRQGWLPREYVDQAVEQSVHEDCSIENSQSNQTASGSDDQLSLDEWEDLTSAENRTEGHLADEKPAFSEDPLANAIHLQVMHRFHSEGRSAARLNKSGKELYLTGEACRLFQIHDYTHCDFYLAADQQTPLIHLHNNPTRESRKIAIDNKKSQSAGRVSVKTIAWALGWQSQQEWEVQGTARADVIKLVTAEQ